MEAEDIDKDKTTGAPGMADNDTSLTDALTPAQISELRAEVSKWQERVPKLASALRERTEELAQARDQLRQFSQQSAADSEAVTVDDARLQARNDVIRDLEEKMSEQAAEHRKTAGELHTLKMELQSAEAESAGWKEKWHAVTHSLDDAVSRNASAASALEQQLASLQAEKEELLARQSQMQTDLLAEKTSLQTRNQNLQQTTAMLNSQMESMADELSGALQQTEQFREQIAASEQALQASSHEVLNLERLAQQNTEDFNNRMQTAAAELKAAEATAAEAQQLLQQAEQKAQQRIHTAVSQAQQTELEHKDEIRNLQQHNQQLQSASAQLQAEKAELAAIVDGWQQAEAELQARLQRAEKSKHELAVEFHALVENNSSLVEERESVTRQFAAAQSRTSELEAQLAQQQKQLAERQSALESAQSASHSAQSDLQSLQAQADQLRQQEQLQQQQIEALRSAAANARTDHEADAASLSSETLAEMQAEITRLTECLAVAQQTQDERDAERRELGHQLDSLKNDNARLKTNLQDRSELVRQLEQEAAQAQQHSQLSATEQVSAQHQELQRKLVEADRRVETFREHAQILEEKLGNQQGTFEEVERELSEIQDRYAQLSKAADNKSRQARDQQQDSEEKLLDALQSVDKYQLQNEELQQSVHTLEQVVEDLNLKLANYLQHGEGVPGQPDPGVQSRLAVLTEELQDARSQIRSLTEQLAVATQPEDDFTQIRGIGSKLAEQLKEAGFNTFAQIAELSDVLLTDPGHPLHSFRSRILRDEWIEQAREQTRSA